MFLASLRKLREHLAQNDLRIAVLALNGILKDLGLLCRHLLESPFGVVLAMKNDRLTDFCAVAHPIQVQLGLADGLFGDRLLQSDLVDMEIIPATMVDAFDLRADTLVVSLLHLDSTSDILLDDASLEGFNTLWGILECLEPLIITLETWIVTTDDIGRLLSRLGWLWGSLRNVILLGILLNDLVGSLLNHAEKFPSILLQQPLGLGVSDLGLALAATGALRLVVPLGLLEGCGNFLAIELGGVWVINRSCSINEVKTLVVIVDILSRVGVVTDLRSRSILSRSRAFGLGLGILGSSSILSHLLLTGSHRGSRALCIGNSRSWLGWRRSGRL